MRSTEESFNTNTRSLKSLRFKAQIRERMSGPDLHVFTLKFLALKKVVFFTFLGQFYFSIFFIKKVLCNFSARTLPCFQKKM